MGWDRRKQQAAMLAVCLAFVPVVAAAGSGSAGAGPVSSTTSTTAAPAPSAKVVVSPNSLAATGWMLEPGAALVRARQRPPLGTGALRLRAGSPGDRTAAQYRGLNGARLADLTRIEYATNQYSWPPQIALAVDSANRGVADHVLVFGPPERQQFTWNAWNALAGPWTLYNGTEEATHTEGENMQWSQYLARFPNATLRPQVGSSGAFLVNIGLPPGQLLCPDCGYIQVSVEGDADALTIQTAGAPAVTFNFEAAP